MIFFFNLIISVGYFVLVERWLSGHNLSNYAYILVSSPILFFWLIVCGGQENVGTDYFSYLGVFNDNNVDIFLQKGEYVFYFLVVFCNFLGIRGQSMFFVSYGIGFLFLFLFIQRIQNERRDGYIFIYIMLYITVANLFNNQLNALRQAMAIYIGTYACSIYIGSKKIHSKIHSIAWIVLASFIHLSAFSFFLIPLLLLIRIDKIKIYELVLFFSFLFGLVFQIEWLDLLLDIKQLPDHYLSFIQNGRVEYLPFSRVFSKYIFIPFYLFSLKRLIEKNKLTATEERIFLVGFLSFCLRLMTVNVSIVSRVTNSFVLLSIIPLYFCFREILKEKYYVKFWYSMTFLCAVYFLKTILFPGESYLYNSIYFD